jgi:hypothetical protein
MTGGERPRPSHNAHAPSKLRELLPFLLPLGILFLGLAILVASLGTEAETVYSTSYSGTIGPGNQTLPIGPWRAQYLQVDMPVGGCNLHLYVATAAESLKYNSTGGRPSRFIGCTNRSTTTTGAADDLILANDGATQEAYNLAIRAYSIRSPYGWLALPGMFLSITGLIVLVPRLVLEQTIKIRDELEGKKQK